MALFKKKTGRSSRLADVTMGADLISEILERTDREIAEMDPMNIMLIGKTGVGKSTLINNIFREKLAETGIGAPVTEHLVKITKKGIPLSLYDTKGLELSMSSQAAVQKEVQETLTKLKEGPDVLEWIHCVWFCISATSNRLEETEKLWIQGLASQVPVIVVLTQSIDLKGAKVLAEYVESQCPGISGVIPVLALDYEAGPYTLRSYGLKELIRMTYSIVPENVKRAFINAQRVDIDKKAELARRWARRFVIETFAVGFIPIPFADAPIIATSQVTMIAKITAIFGLSYDKAMLSSVAGAMAGVGGAIVTGRTLSTNLMKLVPGAGTLTAGTISGATASAITSAMATVYINVLKEVARREYSGEEVLPQELRRLVEWEMRKYIKTKKKDAKITTPPDPTLKPE